MNKRYVAIKARGVLEIHLPGVGNAGDFDTLCGMNVDENARVDHHPGKVPPGARVNCRECKAIWELAQEFVIGDFGS